MGVFEYAIDSGLIEDNTVPPVRILRKRSQSKHPSLSPEPLGGFLRKQDMATGVNAQTRTAMLLVVLKACRKAEVIGTKWREFNWKSAEREVPAERMKAGRVHRVPLSKQAVDLLSALRCIVPANCEFSFPNRDDPKRPMADRNLNALLAARVQRRRRCARHASDIQHALQWRRRKR